MDIPDGKARCIQSDPHQEFDKWGRTQIQGDLWADPVTVTGRNQDFGVAKTPVSDVWARCKSAH